MASQLHIRELSEQYQLHFDFSFIISRRIFYLRCLQEEEYNISLFHQRFTIDYVAIIEKRLFDDVFCENVHIFLCLRR